MLIYACISHHGYGHGSRSAAVLTALNALRPDWRLVLSTALPESFLRLAFGTVAYERRPCQWDVGVVQADALGSDAPATLAALAALDERLPAQISREAAWLLEQRQPILLLADVPPAAALLGERIGQAPVWLASFGWEAIYGAMGPEFAPWAERAQELYGRGRLLLHCPLAMPMAWGLPEHRIGLTCSTPRLDLARLKRQLQLPDAREECVLISFGGLGMQLDARLLARWSDWVFIGSDPALATAANGRLLPAGARPLDVMPLTGRLITKAGYSSFCEAFSQGVGIHLVERRGFAEAAVLERDLRRHGRHRLLSATQLHSGDWQLDQPLHEPEQGPLAPNGAAEAARILVDLVEV